MSSATFPGRLGVIVIICVVVLSLKVSNGEVQFVLSRNKGTWRQALDSCRSIRGSLAIFDNIELQTAFDRDVKPDPGESVWVGRYVGYSPVVTIDGCYKNQTLEVKRSKTLVNNYLVTCLKECSDTPYIGMQGQSCYCVNSISTRAAIVPGVYCRGKCPGENAGTSGTPVSWCGMSDLAFNTVSVYRKLRQTEITVDINVPNQGECIAYNVRAGKWQPLDCNQPKRFTCDRLKCSAPPNLCVMESTLLGTWFQARERCEGANGRLATVNRSNTDYFKQKIILGDPLYWTGLHRKEVDVWSYDTNPDVIEQSDRCVAAVRHQNNGWQLVIDWCSKEHKYACMQEFTPKTTQNPVSKTTQSVARTAPTTKMRTQSSRPVATSDNLPTINPFATPLSVTSSAARSLLWIQNIAYATMCHIVSLTLFFRL